MTLQSDNDRVIASVRTNIVFEKMIASVVTAAALSGGAHFVITVGARIASGALSWGGFGLSLYAALSFVMLFFLAGFATALVIGIPLFRALERAKLRAAWPYCLAAMAASFIVLVAMGMTPSIEAPARALFLIPGFGAALLFAQKMRPFWVAAARG
jgi:hypothetical protein